MNPYTLSDATLDALLDNDVPYGDATTHALGIGERPGRMVFRARGDLLLCGIEEARRLGELNQLAAVGPASSSGTAHRAGDILLTLEGCARNLHRVWKTAQTLMEYLSGIASETAAIVQAARLVNGDIGIACTRKHFPGTKAAAIKAVLCGGASPHRLGLSETLLVFAEHRAFLDNDTPADAIRHLRRSWPERRIVVEVADLAEALCWQAAGADILQLEKLSPASIRQVRDALPANVRLAAAGGIHSANAEAYARAGADILITSAPYFAPPRDVAVTLTAL